MRASEIRTMKRQRAGAGLPYLFGGKRLGELVGPLFALCFLVYFIYHIFQGERGLLSWLRLQQKVQEDEKIFLDVQSQREVLEHKVYLLRPDSLDQDMLEERVRLLLNFARADEVVIHDEAIGVAEKK